MATADHQNLKSLKSLPVDQKNLECKLTLAVPDGNDGRETHVKSGVVWAKLTNVPDGNGASFFYSIYRSLFTQGLLNEFCFSYLFRETEAEFIYDLKLYMAQSDAFEVGYTTLYTFIQQGSPDMGQQLTSQLPDGSRQLVLKYVRTGTLAEFLGQVKKDIMNPCYWATEIETSLVMTMLAIVDVRVSIIKKGENRLALKNGERYLKFLDHQANTLYLYADGHYYIYLSF